MKKILILTILSLAWVLQMPAQGYVGISSEAVDNGEYIPLLKEGKVWVWNACNEGVGYDFSVYFTVVGQEEIDGGNCFRITQTSELEYLNGYEYILFEENRKVEMRFEFEDGHAEFLPLYDFNIKPGMESQILEVIESKVWSPNPSLVMKAKAELYVKAYGHEWRKIELEDKWMDMDVVWVEGIGVPYRHYMLTKFYGMDADNGIYLCGFRECIDNGETIFTMSDFGETLYIDDLPSETEAIQSDTLVYDMLGRRVTSMSRGGIYVRDGKKFVYLRHESE